MNTFTQTFDNVLDAIQSVLMSILVKIGPFFVALMPASFTAFAIYHTFEASAGHTLALFFALVVGIAWEAVGIVSTHTATDLYNAWQDGKTQAVKFWVMVCLIPVYVVGVAAVVGFSEDAFTPLVKGLGIASPFLTTIVYIAVALARDIKRIETQQETIEDKQSAIEAEQRAWQQEKERLILEQKHAERLSKIDAKKVSKSGVNVDSQSVNQSVNQTVKHGDFDTVNLSKVEQKQRHFDTLLDIYFDNPNAGVSQVARHLNVSRQTVYNYLDELEQAGFVHKNGQGVEVLR